MVKRLTRLVANWEVDAEQMRTNLELTRGAIFSQSVLLALVEAGLSRDVAYRIVQDSARQSHETRTHLRDVVTALPEVTSILALKALADAFDLDRVVQHAGRAVDAAIAIGS
jgi:adenylosuccinate lyase